MHPNSHEVTCDHGGVPHGREKKARDSCEKWSEIISDAKNAAALYRDYDKSKKSDERLLDMYEPFTKLLAKLKEMVDINPAANLRVLVFKMRFIRLTFAGAKTEDEENMEELFEEPAPVGQKLHRFGEALDMLVYDGLFECIKGVHEINANPKVNPKHKVDIEVWFEAVLQKKLTAACLS